MSALLIVPVIVVLAWFARKDPLHSWSGNDHGDGTE